MKKVNLFILFLLCFILIPFNAYALGITIPPDNQTWNNISFDLTSIPDTSSIVTHARNSGYNVLMFYNMTTEEYYLIEVKDYYSANTTNPYQVILYSDNDSLYSYRKNGNTVLGVNSTDSMHPYKWNSSLLNWTEFEETFWSSTSSYQTYSVVLSGFNLIAYEMNNPQYISGSEVITYRDWKIDYTNTYVINPAPRKLYFSSTGSLSALSGDSSGSETETGNVVVNVDFTATNTLLESIRTAVNTINSNLAAFKTSVENNISTIVSKLTTINTTISDMNSNLTSQANGIKTAISNHLTSLQTYLNVKYNELYNVIIYGDKDGEDDYEQEKLEIQSQQAKLDSINSRIADAPNSINNAAEGLGDYISTFTQFYESFTALNVAISSILYLSLAFIVIKKIIGR